MAVPKNVARNHECSIATLIDWVVAWTVIIAVGAAATVWF